MKSPKNSTARRNGAPGAAAPPGGVLPTARPPADDLSARRATVHDPSFDSLPGMLTAATAEHGTAAAFTAYLRPTA